MKRYKMSAPFQKQFDAFVRQAQERDREIFGKCDLELVALSSRRNYRKGLGSALVTQFLNRAKDDGAECVRLFTNTLVSWEFYENVDLRKWQRSYFRMAPAISPSSMNTL